MNKEAAKKKADDDQASKQVDETAEVKIESDSGSPHPGESNPVTEEKKSSSEKAKADDQTVVVDAPKEPSEEEKLRDRLMRLQADFDNYRKRVARDHVDMVKRSNEDLVESLLPVLDHIANAQGIMEKDSNPQVSAYLDGFKLVRNELVKVLESYGVKPIEAVGHAFDANQHEALSAMPSPTAKPGTVLFEVRKGYKLNGRVLRATQVIVSAETDEQPATEATEPSQPAVAQQEPESEETGE